MTSNNTILELNLFPFSQPPIQEEEAPPPPPPPQQITIFYNGSVCVSDVTELQAKAILLLATREKLIGDRSSSNASSSSSESAITTTSDPICYPNGLSMKRSLQRFLQKRNHRMQSTFPYNIRNRPLNSCSLHRH